jgi:AcrR family transcriptional regulator
MAYDMGGEGTAVTARQALQQAAPSKRPKDRRARIALAAAELFCERGYHGVSIDEIAAAVGVSGPAVYHHFPNKYAMLSHATRELSDAVLAATAPPVDGLSARQRLDGMLAELVRLGVQRRRVGGLYQWEGRYLEAEDKARLRRDARTVLDRIATPLKAMRAELTGEQARLLARGVLSLVGSLSTHRAAITPARAQELLCAAGWRLLRARPTALPAAPARRSPAESGLLSRRETVMAEALRLFHLHGYHAVTMEDIAAASGTRASSLYRHFAGKSELLAAVYYRAADRVAATTAAALAAATSPADALARLVDSYVDLVFGQSDLVAVYQAENTNLPGNDRHELRRAQRTHVEEWVRVLGLQRPGLGSADCRILAHGTLNLIADLGRAARFDTRAGADRVVAALALDLLGVPDKG